MTKEEIEHSDRLIAEFMGFTYIEKLLIDLSDWGGTYTEKLFVSKQPIKSHDGYIDEDWFNDRDKESVYMLDDLEYHWSWNALMPVVEKIESTYDDFHVYFGVYIASNSCTIQGTKLNPGVVNAYYSEFTLESKLESTYQAVIEFIKYYNNATENK